MTSVRRTSILGASIALAIDVCVLVATLVIAAVVPLLILFSFAAVPGLVIAPIIGWRFARSAVGGDLDWVGRAIAQLLLLAAAAWVVYVLGFFVLLGPPGPSGTEAGFLAYALLSGIGYALIPTLIAILPIGWVWRRLLISLAKRDAPTV
jgi:hypothetical protein